MESIPITRLINKRTVGFQLDENYDFERVYAHLKKIAKSQKLKIHNHQINTTMLVNEAWLKMKQQDKTYQNRNHFFAVSALAMRHILINESRRLKPVLNEQTVTDNAAEPPGLHNQVDWLIDLEDNLQRLSRYSARLEEVFVYRFFGGMSNREIAELLAVNVRTIDRDWNSALMMLSSRMQT